MDDDMEDEIICELFTTHVHIMWRYIALTSAGIAEVILPGPGESFRSKMLQPGAFMFMVFFVIVLSIILQSGSHWLKTYVDNINHVLGIDKVVGGATLKNFVSASISSDNISEELLEGAVGVYAMQGRRGNMEDRFSIMQDIKISTNKKMSFFGVYDGHGGQFVADFVKENLFKNTIEKLQNIHAEQSTTSTPPTTPTTPEKNENNNNYKAKTLNSSNSFSRKNSIQDEHDDKILNADKGDKNGSDANTNGLCPAEETCANGRRISQDKRRTSTDFSDQRRSSNCSIIFERQASCESVVSGRKNSCNDIGPNNRKSSDAHDSPINIEKLRKGSEVENILPEEISEDGVSTSMKKDEPYGDRRNSSKKKNSIASQKDSINSKDKKEPSTNPDSIYFDSHRNINFTRLLSDQIQDVDRKVVDHCKGCMDMSGTTAVVAVLDGELLVIGNVGDSRAVMGDLKGTTIPLSFDHKPNQLKERRRIKEAGGFISFTGVWRVAGILATSRALGDFPLKDPLKLITAEPDVLTFSIREHKAQFVILATDGLWDVVSNEEAVTFIREHLDDRDYGARALALHAYQLGSQDNITITVINCTKLVLS